jgi:predicted MFS family arabinose efflux permease
VTASDGLVGNGRQGGARRIIVLSMLASGVAQAFGRFSYAILLPAIERDVLQSYALAGALGTVNVAGYLAGTALISVTAARVEPARLMKLGLVVCTTGLCLLTVAPGATALAVGLVLTGIGGAAVWIPAPGLGAAAVPADRRGFVIGLVGSGIGMGIAFSSQLNGVVHVLDLGGWRTVWGVEAAIAVGVTLACVLWLRPATTLETRGRAEVAALRTVPGWLPVTLAYAAYGLSYSVFMNYLVATLEEDAGFSSAHASAVYAAMGLTIIVGGIVLGRLSDRRGRGRTLAVGLAAMAACELLVLVGSEPWAALAAAAFGLVMSGVPAVIAAHLADHLDPRAFGAAFGVITLAFGVLQVIGPQLGGWIGEETGTFTIAFLVAAAAAAAGSLAAVTIPRRPATTHLPTG